MSFLNLSPEATRLRRIAKACAAGELPRLEYRRARRNMIKKFASSIDGQLEDNTVPRFEMDATQRRSNVLVEPVEVVKHRSSMLWMLLLAGLVIAIGTPLWAQNTTADATAVILPVDQRDPNPRTAPTYDIDRVSWRLPVDLQASMGREVEEFLAQGLGALQAENVPTQHGFNSDELEEIGRFLHAIGVHDDNARLDRNDLQDLSALIAAQKTRRGVSLIQIEQLAQSLQRLLRERGFPLATAYVPAQAVTAGTVELGVQFGVLREIRVTDAEDLPLQYRLADLLGKRVERTTIETQLNTLNRLPGIQTEASFQAGDAVGDTVMVLRVKQQRRFTGSAAIDNYALDEFGEERVSVAAQWNNLRGVGDVLSGQIFTSLDGGDHRYAEFGYASPVFGGRFDAAAQISQADISLDAGTSFDGDGVLFNAQLKDTQVFTRTRRRELEFAMGVHDFDWDMVPGQRAWFAAAGIKGHRLWDSHKFSLSGAGQLLLGGLDEARAGQDDGFWRLRGDLNAWMPVTLPWLETRAKVVLDARWQMSNDQLPPTLRFAATGPNSNKGFSQGSLLLDQGIGISSSLRFDASRGQWWLFLDATYGERDGLDSQWVQVSSLGIGWEGELMAASQGRLSSRVTVGYPISHKASQGIEDDGAQVFWSLKFAH